MRLFRLKSRFSKHRAAPRLVLWQAKQCFIRENCGGAVALVVVELLRLALIDDHSSPRPKEAKNYKTQQVSLSAGVPRSYTTLLLPRPNWGPSGSWENSLKPHFDTCLIHFTLLLLLPPCFWIGFVMAELCLLLYILILLGQGNWMHLMRQLCKDKKINHHSFHVLLFWYYSVAGTHNISSCGTI